MVMLPIVKKEEKTNSQRFTLFELLFSDVVDVETKIYIVLGIRKSAFALRRTCLKEYRAEIWTERPGMYELYETYRFHLLGLRDSILSDHTTSVGRSTIVWHTPEWGTLYDECQKTSAALTLVNETINRARIFNTLVM